MVPPAESSRADHWIAGRGERGKAGPSAPSGKSGKSGRELCRLVHKSGDDGKSGFVHRNCAGFHNYCVRSWFLVDQDPGTDRPTEMMRMSLVWCKSRREFVCQSLPLILFTLFISTTIIIITPRQLFSWTYYLHFNTPV